MNINLKERQIGENMQRKKERKWKCEKRNNYDLKQRNKKKNEEWYKSWKKERKKWKDKKKEGKNKYDLKETKKGKWMEKRIK